MVYQVKESKGRLPQNRFTFELDGAEYSVPKLEYLSGRALKLASKLEEAADVENVKLDNITIVYDIFEAACPEVAEPLWDLDPEQVMELFAAWQGDSEASGNDDSSEN